MSSNDDCLTLQVDSHFCFWGCPCSHYRYCMVGLPIAIGTLQVLVPKKRDCGLSAAIPHPIKSIKIKPNV